MTTTHKALEVPVTDTKLAQRLALFNTSAQVYLKPNVDLCISEKGGRFSWMIRFNMFESHGFADTRGEAERSMLSQLESMKYPKYHLKEVENYFRNDADQNRILKLMNNTTWRLFVV